MNQLKTLYDTILKRQPVDSATLPDDAKQSLSANTLLNLQSFSYNENHVQIVLADQTFKGSNTWFVFHPHVELLVNGNAGLPSTIKLDVPYKSQLDNEKNPFGSCNCTSMAMVLAYFGLKGKTPNEQLEDELQDWLETRGLDRHDPAHLAQVVDAYGGKDNFRTDATVEDVKQWLAQGNPCVTHGYFTSSGHIVCIIGYNEKGFIINDPYGEWYADGYDRNDDSHPEKGKALTYSYGMMQQTCLSDGQFWVHFLSKK